MTETDSQASGEAAARREGFLIGALIGSALAARTAGCADAAAVLALLPPGTRAVPLVAPDGAAGIALADALLEELVSGGVDLQRLGKRWVRWWDAGGKVDERLAQALGHLKEYDAPIPPPVTPALVTMAAVLPAAITGQASPQAMLRGAFHVATIIDPTEDGTMAGVAVTVAAWRLLEGHRDFIPEVIAALRANEAPGRVLEAVRSVPRDPRTPPPVPRGETADPVGALTWILWIAHHRPRPVDELEKLARAGGISPTVGAILGALLGAREGVVGWPEEWLKAVREESAFRRSVLEAVR